MVAEELALAGRQRRKPLPKLVFSPRPSSAARRFCRGSICRGFWTSPASSKSERLRAAELLLKLLPESRSDVGSPTGAVSETPLRVYSVPRGSRIDMKTGQIVFPEGVEPEPLEPYDATPQLTLSDQSEYKRERFEVAETEPPANLVRLDVYKSKHDDGDGDSEPPGAA